MITEMRFISSNDTVSAVWEIMAYERVGNTTFDMLNDAGMLVQDREGNYWHVERSLFNTVEKARRYAGPAGIAYDDSEIVVIDLTHTTCDAGTCHCCC